MLFLTKFRDFPSSVQLCHQMQWPNPFRVVLGLFKASFVSKDKVQGRFWRKLRDPFYAPYGGFQNMCSWGTPQLYWSISSASPEYDLYFFLKVNIFSFISCIWFMVIAPIVSALQALLKKTLFFTIFPAYDCGRKVQKSTWGMVSPVLGGVKVSPWGWVYCTSY